MTRVAPFGRLWWRFDEGNLPSSWTNHMSRTNVRLLVQLQECNSVPHRTDELPFLFNNFTLARHDGREHDGAADRQNVVPFQPFRAERRWEFFQKVRVLCAFSVFCACKLPSYTLPDRGILEAVPNLQNAWRHMVKHILDLGRVTSGSMHTGAPDRQRHQQHADARWTCLV